jgi:hypothetical protein
MISGRAREGRILEPPKLRVQKKRRGGGGKKSGQVAKALSDNSSSYKKRSNQKTAYPFYLEPAVQKKVKIRVLKEPNLVKSGQKSQLLAARGHNATRGA